MGGYYLPFPKEIELGQPFGANPGLGPNPAGGHNGDDWLTKVGVPVRAAGDGTVLWAGQFDSTYADNWGWNLNYGGNMVVLNMDGEDGPYFEYGHLSEIYVSVGQRVKAGDIVALTGESDGGTHVITGPHCHVGCLPPNFDLSTNTYGRVNPRLYMTEYWEEQEEEMTPQQMQELKVFFQTVINQRAGDIIAEVRVHTAHNASRVLDALKEIDAVPNELVDTFKAELDKVSKEGVDSIVSKFKDIEITLGVKPD